MLPDLSGLSERINAEHDACIGAASAAISHAIEAGRLLTEAKGLVRHGEWSAWVGSHCRFSLRMSQNYMAVAKNEARFAFEKPQSLRQALQLLAEPKAEPEQPDRPMGPTPWHAMPEPNRLKLFSGYWNQFSGAILLYDLAGWAPDRIAAFVGSDEKHVRAVLRPAPPQRFTAPVDGLELLSDPDRDGQKLHDAYADAVWASIHGALYSGWYIAAWHAENEGFPELAGTARTQMDLAMRRQREIWTRRGFIPQLFREDAYNLALWLCAWEDADQALLLRPPSKSWHRTNPIWMFVEHLDIAEDAIRERDKGEKLLF